MQYVGTHYHALFCKILDALKRNNGLRKRTAEELQISERTLYRKLKQYSKKDK